MREKDFKPFAEAITWVLSLLILVGGFLGIIWLNTSNDEFQPPTPDLGQLCIEQGGTWVGGEYLCINNREESADG